MPRIALLLALLCLLPARAAAQQGERVVSGTVASAGRGAVAVRVVARHGARTDTVAVDSTGAFRVVGAGPGPVELWIEGDSVHHPAAARVAAGDGADSAGIVLVPREWRVRGGRYDGVVVPVGLDGAFQRPCAGCPTFFGTVGRRAGAPVFGWGSGALPLRVAFDRDASAERVQGRDSVALWHAIAQVEADAGADLFVPARFAEVGHDPESAVMVWADGSLRGHAAWGSVGADGAGRIGTASVAFGSFRLLHRPGGEALAAHELMHALGFGHTCAWPSVVADGARCPWLRTDRLSAADVAHLQLAFAVAEAARRVGAPRPWEATLRAHRERAGQAP